MAVAAAHPSAGPITKTAQERPEACPLCGSGGSAAVVTSVRDYEYGAPGEYCWLRCDGCGLVRIDPMPTPEVLNLAYPCHYHAYAAPKSAITRLLLSLARRRTAARLAASLPSGAGVFDIGCSTGLLLEAIGKRRPARLFGVEYKPQAAEAARRRGISCQTGELEDADVEPASMDLAILHHVLEHVREPVETLRRTASILKPGARLVGELPNLDSWDARLFGRYWGGGHAPRHLWHFTPATLEAALRHAGFDDIVIRPALHTGHWALSIQHALRRGRVDCAGLTAGRTWYYPLLLLLTVPVNAVQATVHKTGIMCFEARRTP